MESLLCNVLAPNQIRVSIGNESQPDEIYLQKFCNAKHILNTKGLLNRQGQVDMGTPIGRSFFAYVMSSLRYVVMQQMKYLFFLGDDSVRHQYDGFLTQLRAGPRVPANQSGACATYNATTIEWDVLVGTPGTPAPPEATIDAAHDTITIMGVTFSGLTGLNYVELLRRWLVRVRKYTLASVGGGTEWQLWGPRGFTECVSRLAACMPACDGCVRPVEEVQGRKFDEFMESDSIYLRPHSRTPIGLKESVHMVNEHVFLPRMIEDRPLVGWIFRDQAEQYNQLNGVVPLYGQAIGLPQETELYDSEMPPMSWEDRAFTMRLERNGDCFDVWIKHQASVVISNWNPILYVTGIDCDAMWIPPTCEDDMSFAVASCVANPGGELAQLQVTVASLGASAGDTYRVAFTDGTVEIGTVISYVGSTLVLEFEFNLDCDYGDGPVSIAKIADA